MQRCPNCERQLAGHVSRCQHCGAETTTEQRERDGPSERWKLYAAIAVAVGSAGALVLLFLLRPELLGLVLAPA